ncbi:MAG TPA: GPP34 family phosphoprotein [Ilumatobacter sp.]
MASQDSLAIDFFLLAHDPFDDGRLSISPDSLGCGLVSAKLTDLILGRRLRIESDRVVAVDVAAPADEIDDYVVEAVRSQRSTHPVRSWIEPLENDLYAFVGDRLVASGVVRREQGSRRIGRGRQPDRFPAVDLLVAHAPHQRLEQMVRSPKDLTLAAGMFLALLSALGMDRAIAPDVDRAVVREIVAEIEDNLPTALRSVYAAVQAITGEASLRLR